MFYLHGCPTASVSGRPYPCLLEPLHDRVQLVVGAVADVALAPTGGESTEDDAESFDLGVLRGDDPEPSSS